MEELPVIFRAERDGDVTAVFPTLAADNAGRLLTVYAHIGQHSGGSFDWYRSTRSAKPAEYADLLRELQGIYRDVKLVVRQRMTAAHRRARQS